MARFLPISLPFPDSWYIHGGSDILQPLGNLLLNFAGISHLRIGDYYMEMDSIENPTWNMSDFMK